MSEGSEGKPKGLIRKIISPFTDKIKPRPQQSPQLPQPAKPTEPIHNEPPARKVISFSIPDQLEPIDPNMPGNKRLELAVLERIKELGIEFGDPSYDIPRLEERIKKVKISEYTMVQIEKLRRELGSDRVFGPEDIIIKELQLRGLGEQIEFNIDVPELEISQADINYAKQKKELLYLMLGQEITQDGKHHDLKFHRIARLGNILRTAKPKVSDRPLTVFPLRYDSYRDNDRLWGRYAREQYDFIRSSSWRFINTSIKADADFMLIHESIPRDMRMQIDTFAFRDSEWFTNLYNWVDRPLRVNNQDLEANSRKKLRPLRDQDYIWCSFVFAENNPSSNPLVNVLTPIWNWGPNPREYYGLAYQNDQGITIVEQPYMQEDLYRGISPNEHIQKHGRGDEVGQIPKGKDQYPVSLAFVRTIVAPRI